MHKDVVGVVRRDGEDRDAGIREWFASAATTPISVMTIGPCTLKARHGPSIGTPRGTTSVSQTIDSSSAVRVIDTKSPARSIHAGIRSAGSRRQTARRASMTVNSIGGVIVVAP